MKVEYTCEICGKKYTTAKQANECEKKHKKFKALYYICYISFSRRTINIVEKKSIRTARVKFGEIFKSNTFGQEIYFNIQEKIDFEKTYNNLLPKLLMLEKCAYENKSNAILISIEKLESEHKELINWLNNYTKTQTPKENKGENENND